MPAPPDVDEKRRTRRRDLSLARTAASLPLLVLGGLGVFLVAAGVLAAIAWPLVTILLFGPLADYWLWVVRALTTGGLLLGLAAVPLAMLGRGQDHRPGSEAAPDGPRDRRPSHRSNMRRG